MLETMTITEAGRRNESAGVGAVPMGTPPAVTAIPDGGPVVDRIMSDALAPFRSRFGELVEHALSLKGKKLRPRLVLASAKACGSIRDVHFRLGAVVELVHLATLVHDDLLDAALVRRHQPTINARWGAPTAVLFGDILFSAAYRLCGSVDSAACALIGEAAERICAGELLQSNTAGRFDLSEEDYFEIVRGKTGSLTSVAAQLGARFAGGSPGIVDAMAEIGDRIGIAFQIIDDVLDLGGRECDVGKTLGTDLVQGKMTLPLIRLRERVSGAEWERIVQVGHERNDVAGVLTQLEISGAIESARRTAADLIRSALVRLRALPLNGDSRDLETILKTVVDRNR